MFTLSIRSFYAVLLMAVLALTGCQTAPQKGLTPAQVAVLKQQGFELTDEGWEFGLSGKVLFGSDVESLNKESTEIVERIGKALLGVGIERVRVDGHTDVDPIQSPQFKSNWELSSARAIAVVNFLIANGVALARAGRAQPVADGPA